MKKPVKPVKIHNQTQYSVKFLKRSKILTKILKYK